MDWFGREDRALASGVILFAAILIVGGLLFMALNTPATDIIDVSSNYTSNTEAQNHIDDLETVWNGILIFVAFLAVLFIIARAVIEGRRP